MTKYLITPTLINSFEYYINDEFKSPADSRVFKLVINVIFKTIN